jgi:hypothetical protein
MNLPWRRIIETVHARRAPMIPVSARSGSDRPAVTAAACRAKQHSVTALAE